MGITSRIPACLAVLAAGFASASAQSDNPVYQAALAIGKGQYDAVIQAVDAIDQPSRGLLYMRAYALNELARFGDAEDALTPMGDYTPYNNWPTASKLVKQIETMRGLCPPHMQEVKNGAKVLFRVYYDDDDKWSHAIIALLPQAEEVVSAFLNIKQDENPVFIFSTRRRLDAFMEARGIKMPVDAWAWAFGSQSMLLFSKTDGRGMDLSGDATSGSFRGTVAHEFTHVVVHRYLGTLTIPPWLDEGLAMISGSRVAPGDLATNDKLVAASADANTLMTLSAISDPVTFYGSVDAQSAWGETNPYAQGFSMARYLYKCAGAEGIRKLLKEYASSGDLNKAFATVYPAGLDQFFQDWWKNGIPPG